MTPTVSHPMFPSKAPSIPSFLMNYIPYHYYRSRGWCVRSGIKYGVDLVLYKKGPIFTHAEWALIILPISKSSLSQVGNMEWDPLSRRFHGVSNLQDSKELPSSSSPLPSEMELTWRRILILNRCLGQVQKKLLLTFLVVPDKWWGVRDGKNSMDWSLLNPSQVLSECQILELSLKRWVPSRTRD